MRHASRNICKNYPMNQLLEIAMHNAKQYNENWYVFGQMCGNAKGRKGYEQYPAIGIQPDGTWFQVESVIKN